MELKKHAYALALTDILSMRIPDESHPTGCCAHNCGHPQPLQIDLHNRSARAGDPY